nr:hypothetical protein Iba_chr13eCG10220 [Ipomoea batatas]
MLRHTPRAQVGSPRGGGIRARGSRAGAATGAIGGGEALRLRRESEEDAQSWPLVSKPKLNLTAAALSPHKSSTLGRLLAAAVLAAPVVAEASTAGEEDRSKRVRMRVSRGLGGGGGGCLASGESER